jgi:hypothetical protein
MAVGDGGSNAIGGESFAKAMHSSVRSDTKAAIHTTEPPSQRKAFKPRTFMPAQEQRPLDEENGELFSLNILSALEMHRRTKRWVSRLRGLVHRK